MNIKGIKVKTPYRQPKPAHQHIWRTMERRSDGQIFKMHVCEDHLEPVIKVYDVRRV